MAITRRKQKTEDNFINSAPDGAASTAQPRRVRKGNKVQITLTISEPILDRVDEFAARLGHTRAGLINMAINQILESGITINSNE